MNCLVTAIWIAREISIRADRCPVLFISADSSGCLVTHAENAHAAGVRFDVGPYDWWKRLSHEHVRPILQHWKEMGLFDARESKPFSIHDAVVDSGRRSYRVWLQKEELEAGLNV